MKPVFSALAMTLALTTTAAAGQVCMDAAEMEASLIDWYDEHPVDRGGNNSSELWVSETSGTWTIVQTLADGNACVIAQGEDWMGEKTDPELVAMLD